LKWRYDSTTLAYRARVATRSLLFGRRRHMMKRITTAEADYAEVAPDIRQHVRSESMPAYVIENQLLLGPKTWTSGRDAPWNRARGGPPGWR
jgi:hypothetical protein